MAHHTAPFLQPSRIRLSAGLTLIAMISGSSLAQDGRPEPTAPATVLQDNDRPPPAAPNGAQDEGAPADQDPIITGDEDDVIPAFDNTPVEKVIPFIYRTTGKVVIPLQNALTNKKITIVSDRFVNRQETLDLLFQAMRLTGITIIERENVIILAPGTQPTGKYTDVPVLSPDDDVTLRTDTGTVVIKVFKLEYARASDMAEALRDLITDQNEPVVNEGANQVVILGDIALCQQAQYLIDHMDVLPTRIAIRTFHLKHADAETLEENILDLFEDSGRSNTRRTTGNQGRQSSRTAQPADEIELKVTSNTQTNTVTVTGDQATVEIVEDLVLNAWDRPLMEEAVKMYQLTYTDPLRVQELLAVLLEGASPTQGAGGRAPTRAGGGSQGVQEIVSGIYRIAAYPDSSALVVMAKTADNFPFLDRVIREVDQPMQPNMPVIVALRFADPELVTEQMNALLSSGVGLELLGRERGLPSSSSSLGQSLADGGGGGTGEGANELQEGRTIRLPWQQQSPDQLNISEPSSIVNKVRIVPIPHLNAVAILAPIEYRDACHDFISDELDKPRRQVMISAIIAEVRLTDAQALGIRLSSDTITPARADNSFNVSSSGQLLGTDTLFSPSNLFNTSILGVNWDINALIQALDEKNGVRVLQEPRIFTLDNEAAVFFDGQDVPFVDDSTTSDVGSLTQSFSYVAVGVELAVRPHITDELDVEMEINLMLSNIVAGETLFGGFIINRRETTTQLTVSNGQTIVISGILREEESEIKRKIPFLGDIPIIGAFFSSRETETERIELIAFITPTVVEHPSDNYTNFNRRDLERLNDLTKPLDEQVSGLQNEDASLRNRLEDNHPSLKDIIERETERGDADDADNP